MILNSEPTANEGATSGGIVYQSFDWGVIGFTTCVYYSSNFYRYAGSCVANTEYTISVFIKMDDSSSPIVGTNTSLGDFSFILSGSVVANAAIIEDFGNNVYRVSAKSTSGATNLNNNGIIQFNTQSLKKFRVVGWQLEQGSYPTSYIPTSGTTVTRLADTSSTAGLSSVIGQTEGTMYIDFTYKGLEDVNNMTSLSDGGVSNRVQLNISSSGIGALIVSNGVTSFTSSNTSLVVGNRYKVAVKYKVNDFALWINGTETSTDTLGDVPLNLNRFSFAFTNGTAFHFNQTVSASLLYKTALTDTELATITTI